MMIRKLSYSICLLLMSVTALAIAAADVNGKWQTNLPNPSGPHPAIFEFHAEGDKVSGKMSTVNGSLPISEGKIVGDKLFFVIEFPAPDRMIRIEHDGLVTHDEIKFTRRIPGEPAQEFTAKRVKEDQ
jgi:hypothetical protein